MPDIHARDPDDSVHSRVVDYARRRGQTVSEAVRELLARGLEGASGGFVDAAVLAQQLHMRIAALDGRVPVSGEYHRLLLLSVLESVMLMRQLVAPVPMRSENLQKAQQNARKVFDQMIRDGKV